MQHMKLCLVAASLSIAVALVGCTASGRDSAPSPTITVTASAEPAPTATVTVTAKPEPAPTVTITVEPEEVDEDEGVLVFEALGEGTANVSYTLSGALVQKDVELPFATKFGEMSGMTVGVVQTLQSESGVGCIARRGIEVVKEIPVTPGQLYADCSL